MAEPNHYDVLVIGGGHAGVEAAWAAANILQPVGGQVALVTMDAEKIAAMSCNPAIGGLAKGQMVREVDALGGLMGMAADATGIQFRMLNASKGPAVHGPRCQSDKYRYAREVQRYLETRANLHIVQGTVERFVLHRGKVVGIVLGTMNTSVARPDSLSSLPARSLGASAIVLTAGTFMRGLMHTGQSKTQGGRIGESSAVRMSRALTDLGFELGRLKTGTPPRLAAETIAFDRLDVQGGDDPPVPFSDLTDQKQFPVLDQRVCWATHTNQHIHEQIRANLDRAPMYNGQIDTGSAGPRYCPSIEDKVVRFADKSSHHIFLEPESLDTNEIYCNGISTSLPADVQDAIVHNLPGCERATILRYGYAVEYDMVWPHQIDATCMTKRLKGLFLAGQINGTSGYEEAAGQGLLAGLNAARYTLGKPLVRLRRDQAYIGVMMDDLVTKTPREPYRMFTSRAEFRLLLRADNASERLTSLGRQWGLIDDGRWSIFKQRQSALDALRTYLSGHKCDGTSLLDLLRRPETSVDWLLQQLDGDLLPPLARDTRLIGHLMSDVRYEGYLRCQERQIQRLVEQESTALPGDLDYRRISGLRSEAQHVLEQFRPATLGQAARLAGINPADLMLLSVAMRRSGHAHAGDLHSPLSS